MITSFSLNKSTTDNFNIIKLKNFHNNSSGLRFLLSCFDENKIDIKNLKKKKIKEEKEIVSFSLTEEEIEKIYQLSNKFNISKSKLVELIIHQYSLKIKIIKE